MFLGVSTYVKKNGKKNKDVEARWAFKVQPFRHWLTANCKPGKTS